jgi:hypothetical protein
LSQFKMNFMEFSEDSIENMGRWMQDEDLLMADSDSSSGDEEESMNREKDHFLETNWDIGEAAINEIREMFNMYDDVNEEVLEASEINLKHDFRQYEAFLSSFCDILEDMSNSKEVFLSLKDKRNISGLEVSGPGGVLVYLTMKGFNFISSGLKTREEMKDLDTRTISDYLSTTQAIEGSGVPRDALEREISQIRAIIDSVEEPFLTSIKRRLNKLERDLEWIKNLDAYKSSSTSLSIYDKNSFLTGLTKLLIQDKVWEPHIMNPDFSFMTEMLLTYAHDHLPKVANSGVMGPNELVTLQKSLWSPILSPSLLQAICYYINTSLTVWVSDSEVFSFHRNVFPKGYVAKLQV